MGPLALSCVVGLDCGFGMEPLWISGFGGRSGALGVNVVTHLLQQTYFPEPGCNVTEQTPSGVGFWLQCGSTDVAVMVFCA